MKVLYVLVFFSPMAPWHLMGQDFLIFEASWSHSDTLCRTPLDGWSARRRDFYLTTNHTHKRRTSLPLGRFESTIPAIERPQTPALDGAATGIGCAFVYQTE